MKNNLRMLSLAWCMLPMCLHAGTGEDFKQTYQAAELIPAGTVLPITLNSTLRSDKSESGATITATVMQDVPLGAGKTLRRGSKVTGHVVETITPGEGSDESKISFQFDGLRFENRTVPITSNLRALASFMEVDAAQVPTTGEDGVSEAGWSLVKIGGDQMRISPDVGAECGGGNHANHTAQAFWLFSPDACGAYGFGEVQISRSGRTPPVGEVTLTSNGKAVKVGRGSAMLLRVDGSGPEEALDRTTRSRGTAQ
jgi:hypothetical protein